MTTLVPSICNGSALFLQVTRATIKAWMSFNFGQIQQPIAEFVENLYIHYFSLVIDQILFKVAD